MDESVKRWHKYITPGGYLPPPCELRVNNTLKAFPACCKRRLKRIEIFGVTTDKFCNFIATEMSTTRGWCHGNGCCLSKTDYDCFLECRMILDNNNSGLQNVRGPQLQREFQQYRLEILGLSDARWDSGGFSSPSCRNVHLYSGTPSGSRCESAAGLLLTTTKTARFHSFIHPKQQPKISLQLYKATH